MLYPNPTDNICYVELGNSNNELDEVPVFNVLGKEITTMVHNNVLSLANQPSGVYIVKITLNDGSVIAKRLVKQ
ncbi:MAG: T9SS type A sorting domain-containing protein [Flavobacteriales bacterium]|nr:T9SS type A sorting domain-containing protein [Flavobacteriales bacterium]